MDNENLTPIPPTVTFTAPDWKVLIVDDMLFNRLVHQEMFRFYKVRTTTCTTGQEAIQLIQLERFDMVIIDFAMPQMNGAVATRFIRNLGHAYKDLIIVALTACSVDHIEQEMLESGCNQFVSKPLTPEKLQDIFEQFIPENKRIYQKT